MLSSAMYLGFRFVYVIYSYVVLQRIGIAKYKADDDVIVTISKGWGKG